MRNDATEAAAMLEQGEELLGQRRLGEAIACLHAAEAAGADADRCAGARWQAWMLLGEMEQAWRESDAIRARNAADPHRVWQGEPLAGRRLIVRCLHGFGDTVQFLRYLPRLRSLAASVVVEVAPRMVPLTRCFAGVDRVIAWGEDAPGEAVAWDVQVEVTELPYLLRTQLADLPLAMNYLHPAPHRRAHAAPLRVGLVATAGEWNRSRSIPSEALRPLLAVDGCAFVSLDHLPAPAWMETHLSLRAESDRARESIAGLAETIAGLDLVITVDTLAAHLAGALGMQAWVLLQFAADWRWMHAREDSPWYPSLRLFRQQSAGDWGTVIERVRDELDRIACGCSLRRRSTSCSLKEDDTARCNHATATVNLAEVQRSPNASGGKGAADECS